MQKDVDRWMILLWKQQYSTLTAHISFFWSVITYLVILFIKSLIITQKMYNFSKRIKRGMNNLERKLDTLRGCTLCMYVTNMQ